MSEPAPAIAIGVTRLSYAGAPLFENLSFRLEAGRWTCLLGPSGVGKTSLLRLVAGLESGALVATEHGQGLKGRIALMAQQDLLKVADVRAHRGFLVRAAIDVIEQLARKTASSELAVVVDRRRSDAEWSVGAEAHDWRLCRQSCARDF